MRYLLLLLCFCIPGILFRCSNSSIAGGGDDFPNSIVGTVVDATGIPCSNTRVTLIPRGYNPVTDQPVPNSFIDTTDASGTYFLTITDSGTYTIEAVHLLKRTRLLITGISIAHDTTYIATDTLKQPGAIKLFIPDTLDTAKAYAVIPGTTIYASLAKTIADTNGASIAIDSVPEAILPAILYHSATGTRIISDTITVNGGETAEAEAFVYWARYTTANAGLKENRIITITFTQDNTLWISMFFAGIGRLSANTWQFFDSANSVVPNEVMDIVQDKYGLLFFGTMKKGYLTNDGSTWKILDTSITGLPANHVSSIAIDSTGNVWLGMYTGLASYNTAQNQYIVYDRSTTGFPTHRIQDVTVDADNSVWFATDQGVGKYDNTASWTFYTKANSFIPDTVVFLVVTDKNNNKWFGHGYSVSRFDGNQWILYDAGSSPMLSGRIRRLFVDNSNGVWVGTDKGLTRFDGVRWTDYSGKRYALLDQKRVESIAKDASGNVWVGTFEDGLIGFGPTIK